MSNLLSLLLNAALVLTAIYVHYEVLSRMSRLLPVLPLKPRSRVMVGVLGVMFAHCLEVSLFAAGYWLSADLSQGFLTGHFTGGFGDYIYYSFATFTTLGFGDIVPKGHFRWLTGIEALTGFVLITWSASFLFLEMSQNWRHDQ